MKKLIFTSTALLLTITIVLGQTTNSSITNASTKHHEHWGKKAIRYGLFALAGYAEGVNDAISFHYDAFKKVHPGASDSYWNPAESWKNKYANYDEGNKSEKFPLSTSVLVFATDGFHLTNMVDHLSMIGAATITIPLDGKKRSLKWYVKELICSYIANRAGFYLSYNVIYGR